MSRVRTIRVADCVHFCAFRYGCGEFNPYENYISGLASGTDTAHLRAAFEDAIRHFRPCDLGSALGVVTSKSIPLWLLPWKSWLKLRQAGGWRESLDDIVDIVTYFSPHGIRYSRFVEEYGWLESAWRDISQNGYLPDQYSHIQVFELRGPESSRFIVLDGNHRLSALAALGVQTVAVQQSRWAVAHRRNYRFWPLVLSGHVPGIDALRIFDAYFKGNSQPPRALTPAAMLMDS